MSGQENGVTLVTGSKKELDETLTDEEIRALSAFDDAIARQGNIDSLDAATVETLEKIWIVRKSGNEVNPIIKTVLGAPVYKRSDYF